MVVIKKVSNKCWQRCSQTLLVEMYIGAVIVENSLVIPQKIIEPPYDLNIQLLGIFSNTKMLIQRYIHPMFTVALFTVAKIWKYPTCPTTH